MVAHSQNGQGKDPSIRVLLIDNDPDEARRVKQLLSKPRSNIDFELECKEQLGSGLDYLNRKAADIVLVNLSSMNNQGLDSFIQIQAKKPSVPIIVIAHVEHEDLALEAVRQGAQDYWLKGQEEELKLAYVMRHAIARKRSEYVLRESERRLHKHNQALTQLVKSKNFAMGHVHEALQEIIKTAAETLEVNRTGVWLYDNNDQEIHCTIAYQRDQGFLTSDKRVDVAKFTNYFASHEHARSIAVHNIHKDKRAQELLDSHLTEFGVKAFLDAPIRLRGRIIGFLCHWQNENTRHWALEEQTFASSMADLVALAIEVGDRKQAEEQLERLAYYDSLTNLPNRPLFVEELSRSILTARQYQTLVSVLYLGLDHFKRINDTLGHAGGDELLKAVAERLKGELNPKDRVSRIGGDAFAILLSNISKTKDAVDVTNRIANVFKAPFLIHGQEFFMSWSVGISFYPMDGRDASTLLKNSDTAMFRAKQQGRNNFQFYSPAMNAKALERLVLENSLRHALERDEFRVHYQPIIDLKTGRITCAEALLRWEHPNLGLISPGEFIPLAEETGLIVPIGEWVFKTACMQNKSWQTKGYDPVRVTVNLSARQFQHEDLVKMIKDGLKEAGLKPQSLELELTESLIMHNAEKSTATLRDLSAMGLKLSIDDFGTGYSSLNYLKRFPIHTLKIDRSFVRDITTDPDDAAIVKAIISMAHSLKIEVVAESVETQEQLEFLRSHGCDKIQGFIFSRAVPFDAFEQLLAKKSMK
jgi:diguanylate cyclase (GGDEF)-like protein